MSKRRKSKKANNPYKISQEALDRKRYDKKKASRLKKARKIKKLMRGE